MELRDFLIAEMLIGFVITTTVTVFYGYIAPWHKHSAGRYIFGLLLSLSLVLGSSMARVFFPFLETRILSAVLFGAYIVAISFIGVGIWNAQIGHYRRKKFIEREKELHNPNNPAI